MIRRDIRFCLSALFITVVALWCVGMATAAPSPATQPPSLHAAQSEREETADALVDRALRLYEQQNFEEALSLCTIASLREPDNWRAPAMDGYVYVAQRKYLSASGAFANAIRRSPRTLELYLDKARVDSERGARDEAIQACRDALAVDPSYAEANAQIGEILQYDDKRIDEAAAAFQAAIDAKPTLFEVYEKLGQLLRFRKENPRGAEEVFRKGLEADPQHMVCRYELGRLLVDESRLVEARALWNERTIDLEDKSHPSFLEVLERAERLKKATDALARTPSDPDALLAMGFAVMDGDHWVIDGRQERAIEYFKRALRRRPGFARAQFGICKAYVEIADTFEKQKPFVEREIAKLRKLDPALADEAENYRRSYRGGFRSGVPGGAPIDLNR